MKHDIRERLTSNGVDKRVKLLLRHDGVKELGVDSKLGQVMARSEYAIVIKWPGYAFNPGSRNSGLLTYIKTEISTYLIDEVDPNYSNIYGSGEKISCECIVSYNARK